MPDIEVQPGAAYWLERTAPGDDRIELFEESAEIEIWIRLDSVEFSLWSSNVTVQTHCN
jgi:hypothetical protein